MIARFPGKCARTGRAIKPGDVLRRVQWEQRRLMSGAYVLIRRGWLPTRSTRRDIIEAFQGIV